MSNTASRIVKNTGFLYAKMGITMSISLYTTRLVLNALGASDFGIFNVVGGAIAMLGFLHVAMSSATQRFMSYYEGKGDREKQKFIFNTSSVLHFGIALVLALALVIAGFIFFNGVLNIPEDRMLAAKVIYGSLIISTIFTVMSVPYEAVLNAHENMLYYSIVGVVESLLKLATAIIIVYYAGDKLILYGILMAGVSFISRTIMQIYCRRKYSECVIAPRKYWDKPMIKEMTSFAGWSFLGSVSSIVTGYGQGLVLNMFFGTTINAAQGVANQLSGQLGVFSTTMLKALNPVLVKSEGGGNRTQLLKITMTGSKLSYYLLAILVIPAIIEMPFILKIWIKTIPEYSIIFAQLMLIQKLIAQPFFNLATSISATGRIKNFQIFNSILTSLPLMVSYILFKIGYSPVTMYITFIGLVFIRSFGIILYFSHREFGLPIWDYLKQVILRILFVTGIALVMALIPWLLLPEGLLRLTLVIVIYCTSFLLVMLYYGLNKEERSVILKLGNSVLKKFGINPLFKHI